MSIANEIQRLQSAKADIKSAIEQKGVTVGDGTIDTYASLIGLISGGGSGDYEQGFEDGKNSMPQFDRYMKTGTSLVGMGMFTTSKVELNCDNIDSFNSFLYEQTPQYKNTIVEHFIINCTNIVTNITQMFRCGSSCIDMVLKKVTINFSTQNVTNFFQMFGNRQALEVVDGVPFDFSSSTTSTLQPFVNCYSLIDFRVVANSIKNSFTVANCPNLSTDTIQSIIDGLADLTGGTAQTLTLHNDVKILQSQVDSANAKGWTIAGGTVVSEEEYYE